MRISVHPGPSVVNLQAINDKRNSTPVRRVKKALAIAELLTQSIHDRLPLVTAFRRRVQFITYFVCAGCRLALLVTPG